MGTVIKKAFPNFGNGNEKLIPKLWEQEWENVIPRNDRERKIPLVGTGKLGAADWAPADWAPVLNIFVLDIYCQHLGNICQLNL